MDKLTELIQKKKEIEAEIRFLQNETVQEGVARVQRKYYSGLREYAYHVSICNQSNDVSKGRWSKVAKGDTKEELIKYIHTIINDLSKLSDKLREELQ